MSRIPIITRSIAFVTAGVLRRWAVRPAVTRRISFRRWTNSPSTPARLRIPDRSSAIEGRLPDALDTGNYTLTLRVEDVNNDVAGHDISRPVVLTI